ncbi:DUF2255 family protein [Kribbella sp. CA-253562]|uniref:DUF2255 family protein n=1 Tax=Kribbella sp. CA-253562 TaxID=3239942 RepID=UPI003D90639F
MPARTWTPGELDVLSAAYSIDLHANTDRNDSDDSVEIGMVVVAGSVFVRAFRGTASRWYEAAKNSGTGWIRQGETRWKVAFTAVPASLDPQLADRIDDAYVAKYGGLASGATGDRMREATLRSEPLTS